MAVGPALADGGFGARRGGAAWFLLLALGCGTLAATVAVRSVRAARHEVPVLLALRAVPPLQRVAAADVRLAEVPSAAVPPGAERAAAGVVGRFARYGLVPGEVVTAAALEGGTSGLSALDARIANLAGTCPPGAAPAAGAQGCADVVAVTLPLSADQGFDMVRAGDRVDIAASYPLQVGPVAQVLATDVPVLQRLAASSTAQTGGGDSGWLVLGCSPRAALRLQLAQAAGKVSVLLRPLGAPPEDSALRGEVVDLTGLASGGVSTAAAAPAEAGILPAPAGGAGG